MTSPPDWNESELAPWLREGLEALSRPEAAAPVEEPPSPITDLRGTPAWNLVLDAALASSFLPRDLAPGTLEGPERERAERSILDHSNPVKEPEGIRWTLSPEARAQAISASTKDEVHHIITGAESRFVDLVSGALRQFAAEEPPSLETANLNSLEAQRTALSMFGDAQGLKLPPLENLDREVQLKRLRAGFERMTGARAHQANERPDRFFGRDSEMQALRNYVDVVPTDGLGNALGRFVRSVRRAFVAAPPMTVWGTGGVGKTTLMAKFMLEHAQAADDKYPFAYLDFDRSTVSARDPVDLLAEMCRQVGVQFDELKGSLGDLEARLGEVAQRLGPSISAALPELAPYQAEFRRYIDSYLESQEQLFSRQRPILIVFDTFEVAQYSRNDVQALEKFIENFAPKERGRLWPRLRLVISGRKPLTSFLGDVASLELGPLDPAGSAQLLSSLAADLKLPMTEDDAIRLVRALAKAGGNPKEGVHPLRLRLVGEVFSQMLEDATKSKRALTGAQVVDTIISDLGRPDSGIIDAFINGFLVRRILDHLNNDDVRALADPGLVVRRISPEIIREVMAKATPAPTPTSKDTSAEKPRTSIDDSLNFTPWSIDTARASLIYDAFDNEVTLVTSDENGVRFRQDVRREMLPLIRARRPNRFRLLHQTAWDFFAPRADSDPADLVAAGEAVYHGLWLGRPLPEVNQYWRNDPNFEPRIDPEEFIQGSLAEYYLRAKSNEALTADELRKLGPELGWEWLQHQGSRLLQDSEMNDAVATCRAVVGDRLSGLERDPALAAVICRLLCRTGEWGDAVDLAERFLFGKQTQVDIDSFTSLLRTWLTIVSKTGRGGRIKEAWEWINGCDFPLPRAEMLLHAALVSPVQLTSDKNIADAVARVGISRLPSEVRILRLATLVGPPNPQLIAAWFTGVERLPRDRRCRAVLKELFEECYAGARGTPIEAPYKALKGAKQYQDLVEAADTLWRIDRQPLLKAAGDGSMIPQMLRIIASDHRDWIWPMRFSLERRLESDPGLGEKLFKDVVVMRASRPRQGRMSMTAEEIVDAAGEDGNFLTLAHAIVELDSTKEKGPYPNSVRGIASALLRWDERLRPPEEEPKPQPKPRPIKRVPKKK